MFFVITDYIIIGCVFGGLVLCILIVRGLKKKLEIDRRKSLLQKAGMVNASYQKHTDDIYVVSQ